MVGMAENDPVLVLDREMQALVRGIQGAPPPDSAVDASRIWDQALTHGVAPLLHQASRHATPPGDIWACEELHALRRANAMRGALALRQRDEVLAILQSAGIPCLTLKGAALAKSWYRDLSLRPFVDIDILVPREHVQRARELLLQAGYESGPDTEARHHLPSLIRWDRPCFIELHYYLTRLDRCYQASFDDLYSRSMTVLNSPGAPVRTLSPEDTLIHLCLHVLAHIDHDHGWQLRHLCDISRHVAVFAIDWTAYGERTRALGVEAGCAAVLALSHLTAGAVVPEEYQDRLRGIQLLTHAIPGPTQHRLLAIFLKAIASGHVRQAVSMVYRSMVDGSQMGEDDTVRIRPRRSLSIVARIAREMVQHPSRMIRQLHVWIPWAEKQKDRERLLVELLPPR